MEGNFEAPLTPAIRLRQLLDTVDWTVLSSKERNELVAITIEYSLDNDRDGMMGTLQGVATSKTVESTDMILTAIKTLREKVTTEKRHTSLQAAILLRIMEEFRAHAPVKRIRPHAADNDDDDTSDDGYGGGSDWKEDAKALAAEDVSIFFSEDQPPNDDSEEEDNIDDLAKFLSYVIDPRNFKDRELKRVASNMYDTITQSIFLVSEDMDNHVLQSWRQSSSIESIIRELCVSFRLATSALVYTSVLEDFKTSLGNALGLSRTALASMMPRLRSQQSLLQHQEEEVRDGNDLLSASDGNMVTIGAIIEMQAKDNTWHKVVVTKINRTALLGVCLIEGLPISEEAKAAEYYTPTNNNGTVQYCKTSDDTTFGLPKGTRMYVLPEGNAGAGVYLPFEMCVRQMLEKGLLVVSESGTLHIRIGIDGTQLARSESQYERFVNTCLSIVSSMTSSHFEQSIYSNILISAFTSSDSATSYKRHIMPLMREIQEGITSIEQSEEDILYDVKKVKIWNLSDGKLQGLAGQRRLKAGDKHRNNLYTSVESISTARAFNSETKELLFALSVSRFKEWEKFIFELEEKEGRKMCAEVAAIWNVPLASASDPGYLNANAFDYDTMLQEDLHHSGRNAIVVIEYAIQLASFAGVLESVLKHWIDTCKISMANHSFVLYNDGQSCQLRTRVGGAQRLVAHPEFIGSALLDKLNAVQREWMTPAFFLGILYRMVHLPLKSRDLQLQESHARTRFILTRQFAAAIVSLGGPGRLKDSLIHGMAAYAPALRELIEQKISHTVLDNRAVETQHTKSRGDLESAGNLMHYSGCRITGHQHGMKALVLRQLQRVYSHQRRTREARLQKAKRRHEIVDRTVDTIFRQELFSLQTVAGEESDISSLLSADHFRKRRECGTVEGGDDDDGVDAGGGAPDVATVLAHIVGEDIEDAAGIDEAGGEVTAGGNGNNGDGGGGGGGGGGGALVDEQKIDRGENAYATDRLLQQAELVGMHMADHQAAVSDRQDTERTLELTKIVITTESNQVTEFPLSLPEGVQNWDLSSTWVQLSCRNYRFPTLIFDVIGVDLKKMGIEIGSAEIEHWCLDDTTGQLQIKLNNQAKFLGGGPGRGIKATHTDPTQGKFCNAREVVVEVAAGKVEQLKKWMEGLGKIDRSFARKKVEIDIYSGDVVVMDIDMVEPIEDVDGEPVAPVAGAPVTVAVEADVQPGVDPDGVEATMDTDEEHVFGGRFLRINLERVREFNAKIIPLISQRLVRRLNGEEYGIAACGLVAYPGEKPHLIGWHVNETLGLPWIVEPVGKSSEYPYGYKKIEIHTRCRCKFPVSFERADGIPEGEEDETEERKKRREARKRALDAVEKELDDRAGMGEYPLRQTPVVTPLYQPAIIQTVEEYRQQNPYATRQTTQHATEQKEQDEGTPTAGGGKPRCSSAITPPAPECTGKASSSKKRPFSMYNYCSKCTKLALTSLCTQLDAAFSVEPELLADDSPLRKMVDDARIFLATPPAAVGGVRLLVSSLLRAVRLKKLSLSN